MEDVYIAKLKKLAAQPYTDTQIMDTYIYFLSKFWYQIGKFKDKSISALHLCIQLKPWWHGAICKEIKREMKN